MTVSVVKSTCIIMGYEVGLPESDSAAPASRGVRFSAATPVVVLTGIFLNTRARNSSNRRADE